MILERLAGMGVELPDPPQPAGAYTPVVLAGDLAFVSGQIPVRDGRVAYTGVVDDSNVQTARDSARLCAVNVLAQLQRKIGLDRVQRFVRINGFVRAGPDFTSHPKVIDAASDLLYEAFGDRGRHTRTAVGVGSLPLGSMTEIDAIVRI